MHVKFLSVLCLVLVACSSAPTQSGKGAADETGMKGIAFDMPQQAVLEKLRATDTIVEATADRIVSEGPWDADPSIQRKTFTFQENKLQCVRYAYVKGKSALPSEDQEQQSDGIHGSSPQGSVQDEPM